MEHKWSGRDTALKTCFLTGEYTGSQGRGLGGRGGKDGRKRGKRKEEALVQQAGAGNEAEITVTVCR